eukprot:TRINITY_DN7821_c0_g1_i1.p3 TRINITY_DN7821_c0_g1~~TRINITY_DN7821_c0_g1_i1.p3  ORF type:complete len:217 (-),score=1.60 TRINITY_DN7821_c0_g1_i1:1640-2290(-)
MSGSTNRSSLNHQVWHTQNFLQNIRILDKIFNFITQRLSGRRQLSDLKYYQVTKYSNNNFRFAQNLGALILSLQNLHNLSPVLQDTISCPQFGQGTWHLYLLLYWHFRIYILYLSYYSSMWVMLSSGQTLGVKAQRFRGHTSPHRNVGGDIQGSKNFCFNQVFRGLSVFALQYSCIIYCITTAFVILNVFYFSTVGCLLHLLNLICIQVKKQDLFI